jgi:hypothetical protein
MKFVLQVALYALIGHLYYERLLIIISFWNSATIMRDIYEYVVYCGPWLAEVNKLSIQPWDKISNFFLISLFCFGIEDMPYGGVFCQYLNLFVFVSGMKHPRFQVYHFCPC